MQTHNTYLLKVGEKGKERLDILNELFSETSRNLLLKAGLKKNLQILEIGCGTGEMTAWMAEVIGEKGHIYAVDSSPDQIEIAKENASKKNVTNITFINQSIFDLKNLPMADLIYERFVLMHLEDPLRALELLKSFLKAEGKIVCEEPTNSATCCYPVSLAFIKFRQLSLKLVERINVDYNFGEKIYFYFKKLNLHNDYVNFVQPILLTQRQKSMLPLLIHEMKHHYIKYQIASEGEIEELLTEMNEFTFNDNYLVSFPRTTQIIGSLKAK